MNNWARKDIAELNKIAAESPDAMRKIALMASLSIQQAWSVVPNAMEDVSRNGRASNFLWGFKQDTYDYLTDRENINHLYTNTLLIDKPVDLLDLWTTVPGLGLAKAGFVVQMTRGMVGCVDGHNAQAYDVRDNQLTFPKGRMTLKAQRHKLEAYVKLTKTIGGSEYMWREWCILMAGKYPDQYENAHAVSQQHVWTVVRALNHDAS